MTFIPFGAPRIIPSTAAPGQLPVMSREEQVFEYAEDGYGEDFGEPQSEIVGATLLPSVMPGLKSLFRKLTGGIFSKGVEILNRPYPGEPADISVGERQTLWCQELENRFETVTRSLRENTNIYAFITGALWMWFLTMAFLCYNSNRITGFQIFGGLSVSLLIPTVLLIIRSYGLHKYHTLIETVNRMKWQKIYMDAYHTAIEAHCTVCPELKSLFIFLDKSDGNKQGGLPLSPADTVSMVRLSEKMTVAALLPGTGRNITVSGENSELLGRVAERLSGCSLREMVNSLIAPEDVRL